MSRLTGKRISSVFRSLMEKPTYTLMRGFARFSIIRFSVTNLRSLLHVRRTEKYVLQCELNSEKTIFDGVNVDMVVECLRQNGAAFGLKLPEETVNRIRNYAEGKDCYADRSSANGFNLHEKELAEEKLGKKVLVAQYFNTLSECPDIARLSDDPILKEIACKYLGSIPTFVGANLWWTFPVDASEEDKHRHAHLFHRDVDDFKFLKFFFYLTDVKSGDGGHVCVLNSRGKPPTNGTLDRWNIRRYTDEEITKYYSQEEIIEICGEAGDGFAEDTWSIHKGKTPEKKSRLLLQLQFALFDFGVMHDRREGLNRILT